jgi:hypothetical protein
MVIHRAENCNFSAVEFLSGSPSLAQSSMILGNPTETTMGSDEKRSGDDRRASKERRSGTDTRSEKEKQLTGERRSGVDRRSRQDRRSEPGDIPQTLDPIK